MNFIVRGCGWALGTVAAALLSVLAHGAYSQQAADTEPRAVIELFTSQGCSSCPPADRLLGELKKDRNLIAVTLPVHYWDYIGWKDTLADPRHTARQRAYAKLRSDGNIYTPQVVVNGMVQALGSDRAAIRKAVENARGRGGALSVPVKLTIANGQISVDADIENGVSGEVWLWGLASTVPVVIKRGENRGRTITYSNVVRRWVKLGRLPGEARRWTVPVADVKADMVDTVVAIIQSGNAAKPRAILGAAVASLN